MMVGMVFLALGATSAYANTITFAGVTTAGDSVDGSATWTWSGGVLAITLENRIANINTVGQGISGFSFDVVDINSNPVTSALATQVGQLINFPKSSNVASDFNGNPDADNLGWLFAGNTLNALGSTGSGTNPPDELILGPETSISLTPSGYLYSNAGGSITNSKSHQPFVRKTATFTFSLTGVSNSDSIRLTNTQMFFGTKAGTTLQKVPEPTTFLMLVMGFLGWMAVTTTHKFIRSRS